MGLNKVLVCWLCLVLSIWSTPYTYCENYFHSNASYTVYFTPTHDCTAKIVKAIGCAKRSLYVQAYFLTSQPIIDALVNAQRRALQVKVILDKNHPENQPGIKKMLEAGIPVWIDKTSGLAHNKVMIIDKEQVITGSFNFTHAANYRNRENLLLIQDQNFAQYYLQNWDRCQTRSTKMKPLYRATSSQEDKQVFSIVDQILNALLDFFDLMSERLS